MNWRPFAKAYRWLKAAPLLAIFVIFASVISAAPGMADSNDFIQIAVTWLADHEGSGLPGLQVISSLDDVALELEDRQRHGDLLEVIQAPKLIKSEAVGIVSVFTWSKYMGTLAKWEISIEGEEVSYARGEVVATGVGSEIDVNTEGRFLPVPGRVIMDESLGDNSIEFSLLQVGVPEIQVSNHWVEIYDDPDRTQSTEITITGFGADEDVDVLVSVDGVNVPDASGDPLTIHTDDTGFGSIDFTPDQAARTGRALVLAVSPTALAELEITDRTSWQGECTNLDTDPSDDERGGLTLERVLEGQADPAVDDMAFQLHYSQQTIDTSADVDPIIALRELVTAYNQQVGDWGFDVNLGEDYDSDRVAHFYINDGEWMFHFDRGTNSWPDDYCVDPQGKNRRINMQTDIGDVLNNIGAAFGGTDHIIAHEHMHNVQFAYNDGELKWGNEGDWYSEGMARFIETVMDTGDSNQVNPLPSLFYWDIHRDAPFPEGVIERPDRPLTEFDYDFCIFWGFVYQRNNGFESLERILREISEVGNNAISDGPEAVTTALENVGGEHDSMEEVYSDFIAALHAKDFEWEGQDWGALLNDVHEIRDEVFDGDQLIIDNDQETSLDRWGMDYIRVTSSTMEDMELVFSGAGLGNFVTKVILYEGAEITVVDLDSNRLVVPIPNEFDEIVLAVARTGGLVGNYWVLLAPESIYTDVVLDFDRSGSMAGEIEAVKDAAATFIDFLEPPSQWFIFQLDRDRVGLVSFSSSANLDLTLTSDFDQAKAVIDGYRAGGATNMGDALDLSIQELIDRGRRRSIHSVIYLTDGRTNTGPSRDQILNDLVPRAVDNDISIYTFGFGSFVDADFLERVATGANGEYFFAPTVDELQQVYIEISHAIRGWEEIASVDGTVVEGEIVPAAFISIAEETKQFKVFLSWTGSDLDLILRDPMGEIVDPGNTGILYSGNDTKPEVYEVFEPLPGAWAVEVFGKQVDDQARFVVSAIRPGALMQIKPTRWEFSYPEARETTFVISEVGGLVSIEDVVITASDLVHIEETALQAAMQASAKSEVSGAIEESVQSLAIEGAHFIPGSAFTFTPNDFNIAPGGSQDVIASVALPSGTPMGNYKGTFQVTSSAGIATVSVEMEVTVRSVEIDIKPGGDPNSINCNNENGVIPVAILTTDTFDALSVDHTTVAFEGASETHVDKKSGEPRRHEEDVDGDGDIDLVFHFRFGDSDLTCEATDATLIGETIDGIAIQGVDAVRMID